MPLEKIEVFGRVDFVVAGMERSGHHAVAHFLTNQLYGDREVIVYNNMQPSWKGVAGIYRHIGENIIKDKAENDEVKKPHIGCFQAVTKKSIKQMVSTWLPSSTTIVLRDPYNHAASWIRKFGRRRRLRHFVKQWIDCADLFLNDYGYGKMLFRRFVNSGCWQVIHKDGKGSSFQKHAKTSNDLNLFERYKEVSRIDEYVENVVKNQCIEEYANRLYPGLSAKVKSYYGV